MGSRFARPDVNSDAQTPVERAVLSPSVRFALRMRARDVCNHGRDRSITPLTLSISKTSNLIVASPDPVAKPYSVPAPALVG